MYFILFALTSILIYIFVMCLRNKTIPSSISETWYMGGKHWFTILMFISSILLLMGMLEISEGSNFLFISLFTAAGLGFVGAAPEFHKLFEGKIHKLGALALLLGSQIWLCIFVNPLVLVIWFSSPLWINSKNWIFYGEVTTILSVLFAFLI